MARRALGWLTTGFPGFIVARCSLGDDGLVPVQLKHTGRRLLQFAAQNTTKKTNPVPTMSSPLADGPTNPAGEKEDTYSRYRQ